MQEPIADPYNPTLELFNADPKLWQRLPSKFIHTHTLPRIVAAKKDAPYEVSVSGSGSGVYYRDQCYVSPDPKKPFVVLVEQSDSRLPPIPVCTDTLTLRDMNIIESNKGKMIWPYSNLD
jgi:hypothetical protein